MWNGDFEGISAFVFVRGGCERHSAFWARIRREEPAMVLRGNITVPTSNTTFHSHTSNYRSEYHTYQTMIYHILADRPHGMAGEHFSLATARLLCCGNKVGRRGVARYKSWASDFMVVEVSLILNGLTFPRGVDPPSPSLVHLQLPNLGRYAGTSRRLIATAPLPSEPDLTPSHPTLR